MAEKRLDSVPIQASPIPEHLQGLKLDEIQAYSSPEDWTSVCWNTYGSETAVPMEHNGVNSEDVSGGDVTRVLAQLSDVFHRRINNEVVQYSYHVESLMTSVQNMMMMSRNFDAGLHDENSFMSQEGNGCENEVKKMKQLLKIFSLTSSISRLIFEMKPK